MPTVVPPKQRSGDHPHGDQSLLRGPAAKTHSSLFGFERASIAIDTDDEYLSALSSHNAITAIIIP
jgi:hypothetical protein